jgi:hypothetical protein
LFTTSERQWGIAMPRPIPVEPRFSSLEHLEQHPLVVVELEQADQL